ncbi:MAG TPA: hypothetical protein DCZ95_07600 [Verrucomicrobia bacterium]|nr:MAG: hypothetical protein A2X46_01210 [Lentisphaerae bacterium GWF2_57_35]HBA83939.1 hypothetical protein [Verrucomicrobiota bacterium]
MSNARSNNNDAGIDPLLSQPGYVYHRQKPPPRSRYVRATAKPPKEKAKGPNEIIRQTIVAHIVTFVIVMGSMLVLLVLAVVISNKIWALRQQQNSMGTPRPGSPDTPRILRHEGAARTAAERTLALQGTNRIYLEPETIERYHDVLTLWPYLNDPWMAMGQFYMRMNDYTQARTAFELAIGTNWQSARLFNDLGVTHLEQKDFRTAQQLFSAALADDREYTPAYFNLALSHAAQGNVAQARGFLSAYLSRKPDDAKALQEKSILDVAEGRYKDALQALQKAMETAPDWLVLYFDAASVASLMQDTDKSAGYLEHALSISSVMTVYRVYQLPQFKNLRTSDAGKNLEKKMADLVRTSLSSNEKTGNNLPSSHPMTSLSSP